MNKQSFLVALAGFPVPVLWLLFGWLGYLCCGCFLAGYRDIEIHDYNTGFVHIHAKALLRHSE